jgi:hypothetical protein
MRFIALDSHKHDTWALGRDAVASAGFSPLPTPPSSLFPPPYHLRPTRFSVVLPPSLFTHHCLLPVDKPRAV